MGDSAPGTPVDARHACRLAMAGNSPEYVVRHCTDVRYCLLALVGLVAIGVQLHVYLRARFLFEYYYLYDSYGTKCANSTGPDVRPYLRFTCCQNASNFSCVFTTASWDCLPKESILNHKAVSICVSECEEHQEVFGDILCTPGLETAGSNSSLHRSFTPYAQARRVLRARIPFKSLLQYRFSIIVVAGVNQLIDAWPLAIITIIQSIVFSYVYLMFLKDFAGATIYISKAILLGALYMYSIYCFYMVYLGNKMGHALMDNWSFLVLGVVSLVVGCAFRRFIAQQNNNIECTQCLISGSCRIFFANTTLLIEPCAQILVQLCITYIAAREFLNHYLNKKEFSVFSWIGIFLNVFTLMWLQEALRSYSEFVYAYVTQIKYFKGTVSWHSHNCLEAHRIAARYHLGTFAVGSLIILVIRPIRSVLGIVYLFALLDGNPLQSCITSCCQPVLSFFEWLHPFNKRAFVSVAKFGTPFVISAPTTEQAMSGQEGVVAMLNATIAAFQLVGFLMVFCLNFLVTRLILYASRYGAALDYKNAISTNFQCVSMGILGCFVATPFLLSFDTISDNVFFCICLHAQVLDGDVSDRYNVFKTLKAPFDFLFSLVHTSEGTPKDLTFEEMDIYQQIEGADAFDDVDLLDSSPKLKEGREYHG